MAVFGHALDRVQSVTGRLLALLRFASLRVPFFWGKTDL